MFQSLRPNSQIFILHKGETFNVESGFVSNVSSPRPKFNQPPVLGKPQDMVVDISVKINNQPINLTCINATADIDETYSNGETIVITTSRDALNAEINNLKQRSYDIINSVDLHKKLISEYDKVLSNLNPELAEREQQKTEIKSMKEQLDSMSKSMVALMQSQKELIEKLNKTV